MSGKENSSSIPKELNNYILNGWIHHIDPVTKLPERGDGWQRLACLYIARLLEEQPHPQRHRDLNVLVSRVGECYLGNYEWSRAPKIIDDDWWSKDGTLSKDQWIPMVIALGLYSKIKYVFPLWELVWALFLRAGFFWNTRSIGSAFNDKSLWTVDKAGPITWGVGIRAINIQLFYPLLFITDLFLLLNSIARVIASINHDNTGPCLNHQLTLIQARLVMPTPVSWLARHVYVLFRLNPGVSFINRYKGYSVYNVWRHYFRSDSAPPMDKVMKKTIMELL